MSQINFSSYIHTAEGYNFDRLCRTFVDCSRSELQVIQQIIQSSLKSKNLYKIKIIMSVTKIRTCALRRYAFCNCLPT